MKSSDFIGAWRLDRDVFDCQKRKISHMTGLASFTPTTSPRDLLYREEVTHHVQGIGHFFASNQYRYSFEEKGISIYFDSCQKKSPQPATLFVFLTEGNRQALHLCGQDKYSVHFLHFSSRFIHSDISVSGPKKNIIIRTFLTRDCCEE